MALSSEAPRTVLARQVTTPSTIPDGILDLAPGKIAAVATYLEMTAAPRFGRPVPCPVPGRLERLSDDLPRYRRLYARVGEPWLWFSRALLADEALRRIVGDPAVDVWAFAAEEGDVGILELDFRKAGDCELAFFGLVPEACGRGLGRPLIDEAIRRAFARPIRRLWLHTCTLDHPAALPLYMKAGFRPFRRAVEIADDPRLSGHLPRAAAPSFPTL